MGHDSKVARKDGRNGAVPGINVQGGGTFGAIIWQREMGGDRGDAQGPDGVPTSGGVTDHGDDGETRGRWRVRVPSGRVGDVRYEDPPHHSVHQEAEDKHIGQGCLLPRICTVHGGGANARDELVGAMVG